MYVSRSNRMRVGVSVERPRPSSVLGARTWIPCILFRGLLELVSFTLQQLEEITLERREEFICIIIIIMFTFDDLRHSRKQVATV